MRFFSWYCGLATAIFLGLAPFSVPQSAPTQDSRRLNNLGVAYMNQQRLQQALELFQQASALDPELETARLNQGIALLNLQRLEQAREVLLAVSRQNPRNIRAWYNLGLLHKNAGQPEPALAAFDRAAEFDPEDTDTHYFRGLLLNQLQRHQEAIAAFKQALALNPFHVSAEFGQARAYQRLGDRPRARQHLARFQHLTQEKLGVPMSLAYGDQGRYSLAEEVVGEGGRVPPAIPVRFVPVAAEAGLDFVHGTGSTPVPQGADSLAGFLGSGACFLDYDGDQDVDVFLVNSGEETASALYQNQGKGRFADATSPAKLEARGYGLGCTAGDYDNDGWTDLAVSFLGRVALYRNQGDATFRNVTGETGIGAPGLPLGLTFVDYDHDGDLDLYVTRFVDFPAYDRSKPFEFPFGVFPTSNLLWRNNGNGTFTDRTAASGLQGTGPGVAAASTDFNNDRAIDLVLAGWRKAPLVLANPREGHFRQLEPWAEPMPAPTAGVAVIDFNKDGWMDLAFTHWGEPGLTLWRNVEGKRFEAVALPGLNWRRGWGIAALDYDNDGWLDLVAVGETEDKPEIRLLRNRGPDGFDDMTAETALASLQLEQPRALITADYDQDGDTDLLLTQNGGGVQLLRNDGGNKNNWLRVKLSGLADNKSALGTKVVVFAGTMQQKWEVQAASGYLGQSALELTAGLGTEREVEILRLLWPSGVLQDEIQLAAGGRRQVNEIDRRGSSCPILFAWNGQRYQMVSDAIGAAIFGHWVGPGERNLPDSSEYLKVEGGQLKPQRGRLSFRFVEPMEEMVYLDQVRLLAVDHLTESTIYPNEYFTLAGPPASFRIVASRHARPPQGAWDDRGRNVLPELLQRDERFVTGFDSLPFTGFAELHYLELDLGVWDSESPLRLLLHGFIDYFTATSLYAAHQADVHPISPYVEALDAQGRWVRVVEDMGFPAGLPRTMVADLTGRLPDGTRRIRLMTNLKVYWDQILVDNSPGTAAMRLQEVPLAQASLGFLGYPRYVDKGPRGNVNYIYQQVSPTGPYARFAGSYTRYGDVFPLLADTDDLFAIFGPGEEIALEFDPATLPPLPAGWTRDYLFFAYGFVKDMDFYAAHALTVGPLPFDGMDRYPSPDNSYPEREPLLNYQLDYNTRHVSGKGASSFRFQHRLEDSKDAPAGKNPQKH